MATTYKKLTINLSEEIHAELKGMADQQGITITELFKRAMALHKFVWENRDGELLIRQGDRVKEIVLIR